MKAILAGIVLLVVVGGATAYAYSKHIEVSYLTMRADNLERRIIQLESAPSPGVSAGVDRESETKASTARLTRGEKIAWWRSNGVAEEDIPFYPEVKEPEPTLDLFMERMEREQVMEDHTNRMEKLEAQVVQLQSQLAITHQRMEQATQASPTYTPSGSDPLGDSLRGNQLQQRLDRLERQQFHQGVEDMMGGN
jgi:hypothetical protein